jgi:amidase
MRFDEYRRYDGLGLAELIANKEIPASEALEAALSRADDVGPKLNAIVTRADAQARERAAADPTGLFGGVPFLVKDLAQEQQGILCSYGCQGLKERGYAPPYTAEIVARWLRAGLVIFGRTNAPEFGLSLVTEPRAWGPARNPWDLERSPAGSSGGSAAAVAAGIVPLAGANDLGGSIRIPASVCGLFGFKPGRGRTPWGPARGEMMLGAALNHVITRSVRDSAALLDATMGPELASSFVIAPPERPFRAEILRDGPRLRIAFSTRSPLGGEVDAEAKRAVDDAAALLSSLGHHVEPGEPEINGEALVGDLSKLLLVSVTLAIREVYRRAGRSAQRFEPETRLAARLGRALRGDEVAESFDRWQDYVLALNRLMQNFDVFLTPTVAAPPPKIGETAAPKSLLILGELASRAGLGRAIIASGYIERLVREKLAWAPFSVLANLTGVPAMSVPLHWTPQGLPMGVHFLAGAGGEGVLFALAGELERAKPWFDRTPPLQGSSPIA